MHRFTTEPMSQVFQAVSAALDQCPVGECVSFEAIDPDIRTDRHDGERVSTTHGDCLYRSHLAWMNLAETLHCTYRTPVKTTDGFLRFSFRKSDQARAWHRQSAPSGTTEKYGVDSGFFRLHRFEDANLLQAFHSALAFLALPADARILGLGVNRADEFEAIAQYVGTQAAKGFQWTGIDHSPSALAVAADRFSHLKATFHQADLMAMDALSLGRFDLVLAINTLHSPHLDGHGLLRTLTKLHLTHKGGFIIGFPNCRYVDHGLRYGPKVKNYRDPEYSVLLKDIAAYRRYLHQQGFQVKVTGKYTLLLSARPIATVETPG